MDARDPQKGFEIEFEFSNNPYFDHKALKTEIYLKEVNPYTHALEATEVKSTAIKWNTGKDVTVETAPTKASGPLANTKADASRASFFPLHVSVRYKSRCGVAST